MLIREQRTLVELDIAVRFIGGNHRIVSYCVELMEYSWTSKTVVYDTSIREHRQKFLTVENSIVFQARLVAKPSVTNYASKQWSRYEY